MIDAGMIASWVAAGAAWVAVGVSVYFSHQASVRSDRERDDARRRYDARVAEDEARVAEDTERRLREEAERVTWWVVATDDWFDTMDGLSGPPDGGETFLDTWFRSFVISDDYEYHIWVKLFIRNGNEFALRNVAVMNEDTGQLLYKGSLVPGTHYFFIPAAGVGSPGSAHGRSLARISGGAPVEFVEFVDSRGVVWRRGRDGGVAAIDKDPEDGRNHTV